jgi:CubicO group peptidase (beta-lactamase class C family)
MRCSLFQYTITFCLLFGTYSLAIAQPNQTQSPDERSKWASITKVIENMVQKQEIAGATVLIQYKGEIVYFESHGMRDISETSPMKNDSIFRKYSMTKPITSIAAMILVEEGKLQLDTPVGDYVPELKDLSVYIEKKQRSKKFQKHNMTIRQLMNHTSGLTYGFFSNTPVDKIYTNKQPLYSSNNQEMVEKLGSTPLLYAPGTKWHYSIATDVLGHVIEKVSKQSLSSFFKERIFTPLNMPDTTFHIDNEKLPRFTSSYGSKQKPVEKYNKSYLQNKNRIQSGGGGLISTATDYLHFCQMLLQKGTWRQQQIVQETTIREMTQNQLPKDVLAYGYFGFGLGFQIQIKDWGNKGHIGEYGWDGAASTHFWISPKDDLIVIALSQRQPFSNVLKKNLKPVIYDIITTDE